VTEGNFTTAREQIYADFTGFAFCRLFVTAQHCSLLMSELLSWLFHCILLPRKHLFICKGDYLPTSQNVGTNQPPWS